MSSMAMGTSTMDMMEHPESTISVPPLVDERVLLRFCQALQSCADGLGLHDEAVSRLSLFRTHLDNLCGLASLCRLAIAGHPHSLARVVDELYCLSVDFPTDPLENLSEDEEVNEDEPDDRVLLAAAVDLFAGASFVSKDNPGQRDRFIIGVVRAIENAIAFPITFSSEVSTYLGVGDGTESPLHAKIVISSATLRLLDNDTNCVPRVPAEIRRRLECLARKWMRKNPVDEFFTTISGPKVCRIVHWEDPKRTQPDDARAGDQVTLLVRSRKDSETQEQCGGDNLQGFGVMFSPHAPAPVVRIVDDGLQVLVPEAAQTGPIAVVKKTPDFTNVKNLIAEYADQFPAEWNSSVFASIRMDVWAFPVAFGPPILEIMPVPKQDRNGNHPPQNLDMPSPQKTINAAGGASDSSKVPQ